MLCFPISFVSASFLSLVKPSLSMVSAILTRVGHGQVRIIVNPALSIDV